MAAPIVWSRAAREVLLELPTHTQEQIAKKTRMLARFPRMYQIIGKGRFHRHRRFLAGDWVVYYRVVEQTVYIRGLWPARIA